MENNSLMPAGRYYVGDLCYVMHPDWDEFCGKSFCGNDSVEGMIILERGVKTMHFCTMYGDGCYEDQHGNNYPVDAGLIGCIRVEDINDPNADLELGTVIEFETPFYCSTDDGILYFGHVRIDTKGCDDYDEDEDEDEIEEDE